VKRAPPLRLSSLAAVSVLGSRDSSAAAPVLEKAAPPDTSITFCPMLSTLLVASMIGPAGESVRPRESE
jgi:hypothetical protein